MNDSENQIRGAHEAAVERLRQTRKAILALHDQERRILTQIKDCEAAARVFGFELPKLEQPAKKLPRAPDNVREFVLNFLKQSPNGIKSTDAREAYETQFRKPIHPKTMGMTLYRLKKNGIARIDGHIWRPT